MLINQQLVTPYPGTEQYLVEKKTCPPDMLGRLRVVGLVALHKRRCLQEESPRCGTDHVVPSGQWQELSYSCGGIYQWRWRWPWWLTLTAKAVESLIGWRELYEDYWSSTIPAIRMLDDFVKRKGWPLATFPKGLLVCSGFVTYIHLLQLIQLGKWWMIRPNER